MATNALITIKGADRILSALGASLKEPVKLKFLKCLEVCVHWYNDAVRYNHGGAQKAQRDKIDEVRKAANRLSLLLRSEATSQRRLFYPSSLAPFSDLPPRLEVLLQDLSHVRALRSDSQAKTMDESDYLDFLRYQDHFKERSPFEWLAGVYLPEVYFLFFGLGEGWGKGSKYLSFADQALREMKVKAGQRLYTSKAISRAVRLNPVRRIDSDTILRRKAGPTFDGDIPDQLEWFRHKQFMLACGYRTKAPIEFAQKALAKLNRA